MKKKKMKVKEYPLNNIVQAGSDCTSMYDILKPQAIQKALSSTGSSNLMSLFDEGGVITNISIDNLREGLVKLKAQLIFTSFNHQYFQWKDKSYIELSYNEDTNYISLSGYIFGDDLWNKLSEICEKHISPRTNNFIFAVLREGNDLKTRNIGNGSSPLLEDNYTPKVISDINYCVSAFQSNSPSGRIVILNGEPGTGKTHLIRAVLSKLDHIFVIIPSGLADELDKVDFMPLLLDLRDDYEKPICLIIEDGDVCLVPRENDNISTITALLNLSDGILGTMLDLRLIVSTNAKITEIDKAILRPGRLCRQIKVDALDYDQANKVYQSIMKDDAAKLPKEPTYTLAEIYHQANLKEEDDLGVEIKKAIGF